MRKTRALFIMLALASTALAACVGDGGPVTPPGSGGWTITDQNINCSDMTLDTGGLIAINGWSNVTFTNVTIPTSVVTAANSYFVFENSSMSWEVYASFGGRYVNLKGSNVSIGAAYSGVSFGAGEVILNNSRITMPYNCQASFGGSGNVTIVDSYIQGGSGATYGLRLSGTLRLNASNSILENFQPALSGTSNLSVRGVRTSGGNGSISLAGGYSIDFINSSFPGLVVGASGNSSVDVLNSTFNSYVVLSDNSFGSFENSSFGADYTVFGGRYVRLRGTNVTIIPAYSGASFSASEVVLDNARITMPYNCQLSFSGSGNVTIVDSYIQGGSGSSYGLRFGGTVTASISGSALENFQPAMSGVSNMTVNGIRASGGGSGSISLAGGYYLGFVNSSFPGFFTSNTGSSSLYVLNSTFASSFAFSENSSAVFEDSSISGDVYASFGGRYARLQGTNISISAYYSGVSFGASEVVLDNVRVVAPYSSSVSFGGSGNATVTGSYIWGLYGAGNGIILSGTKTIAASDSTFTTGGYGFGIISIKENAVFSANNCAFDITAFEENSSSTISGSYFSNGVYLKNYASLNFTLPASNMTGSLVVSAGPHPSISGYVRLNGGAQISSVNVTRWFPVHVVLNGLNAQGKSVNARNASGFWGYEGPNATTGADGIAFVETQTSNASWPYNITAYGSELGSLGVNFSTSTPEALLIEKNAPELSVSGDELWLPTGLLPALEPFNFTVTVHNLGLANATGANLSFYDNGALFGSVGFDLAAGGVANFTEAIVPTTPGEHTLLVSVYVENDVNASNNNASALFSVYEHVSVANAPELDFALVLLLFIAAYVVGLYLLCGKGRG
jgi:hypothetical protein